MQLVSVDDGRRSMYQHLTFKCRDDSRCPSRRSSISSSTGSIVSDIASVASFTSTATSFSSHEDEPSYSNSSRYLSQDDYCTESTSELVEEFQDTERLKLGFNGHTTHSKGPTSHSILPIRSVTNPANRPQNPRRTGATQARAKPALVRQDERRSNYVDHLIGESRLESSSAKLVDITEQLVACIWPASRRPVNMPIKTGQSTIDLRFFIREILRRSRSSHSTLQVAMYYCFLIWKSGKMPPLDGRRMFLASLMLAYKYLQDRNFSTHAWKSISNLSTTEIKVIEIAFLKAVDYQLFIRPDDWNLWRCTIDLCGSYAQKGQPCPWEVVMHNMLDIQTSNKAQINNPTSELDRLVAVACSVQELEQRGMITPPLSPNGRSQNSSSVASPSESTDAALPFEASHPAPPPAPKLSPLTSPDSPSQVAYHGQPFGDISDHSDCCSVTLSTPNSGSPDVMAFIKPIRPRTAFLVSQVSTGNTDQMDTASDGETSDNTNTEYEWIEDNYNLVEEHEEHFDRVLGGKSKRSSHMNRKRSIRTSGGEDCLPRRKAQRRKM